MTQPPGQPPQDGFGAPSGQGPTPTPPSNRPAQPPELSKDSAPPQDVSPRDAPPPGVPPQGGFTPPTPPPPYGHPSPYGPHPSPYGPQPGSHAPHPGPYAMPPNPYAPPPPPPYGYHPSAAPGGGRMSGAQVVVIAVAAVAALVVLVGLGAWYAFSPGEDDGKNPSASSGGGTGQGSDGTSGSGSGSGTEGREKAPSTPSAELILQVPAPEVEGRRVDSVKGSWLTDSVYAKAGVNKLVGYDLDGGKESWTLPLSGQTCAASREITDDGVAVVVHEEKKRGSDGDHEACSRITAFRVDDGEKLWTKTVAVRGSAAAFTQVTISGTTVAVGGYYGGAALDARTGASLWTPKSGGECLDVGYAGGDRLVAVRRCGAFGAEEQYEVQLLDPKTGVSKWGYKLPAGIDNAKVISTDPVVFGVDSGEITASGATDVFSLDDSGKLRTKITLADGKYSHSCEVGQAWSCRGITVGNGKLYVPTEERDSATGYGRTNEIVSFSLETGKSTGERVEAGDEYTLFPIRMDGPDIIAYKDGAYDKGAQVVSVDGSSLKVTELLETPDSEQVLRSISRLVPVTGELLYSDGRLFMATQLVSKPYTEDGEEYTALGFGAK